MDNSLSFIERYYEEYNLRSRVQIGTLVSIVLFPLFGILDIFVAPQYLSTFALIRFIVMLANGLILLSLRFVKGNRGLIVLCMLVVISDALGIAVMVQILGGFLSSYYQGLTLIIICMVTLIPWGFKESLFCSLFIYLCYLVPSMFNLHAGTVDWKIVITNLFFLTSIVLVVVIGAWLMYRVRCKALLSRIDIENMALELEETNAKLLKLDELKTQFFQNMSHELRTPLTLILAPLGPLLSERSEVLSTNVKSALETMRRNGLKLLKQINDLLDLSKFEEGRFRLNLQKIDVADFCRQILSSIQPLAYEHGLTLHLYCDQHKHIEAVVDAEQFENVILNLLNNAVKFTERGGEIAVSIEDEDQHIKLTVEDTGVGIPENMLESIFDRFSQVDGSSTRKRQGTGIGLSLVREIIKLHGGRIHAESELNKGSRFIIQLMKGDSHFGENVMERRHRNEPVANKKRSCDHEGFKISDIVKNYNELQLIDIERDLGTDVPDESIGSNEYTILVIDDNSDILRLMRFLLIDEYNLLFASSAVKGLEIMTEKKPDLVLCDVMMPGMDGYAFCREVKGTDDIKHIPVILVTARAGSDMLAEGIDAGADDYLSKPFNSLELKSRVRSMIRLRSIEANLAMANQNLKVRAVDLAERQHSLLHSMVKSLVSTIDAKDNYTRDHSLRVTEYTLAIARLMGLDGRELRDIELAALLHDVGKIGVPEEVLHKKGSLTSEEFSKVKYHPVRGEEIIEPVSELRNVASIVRTHHERYDGGGYPDGLSRNSIPIGARIMAIADTYDAMTSNRPYRGMVSHNSAIKEIVRCSGSQFDPEIVSCFLELSDRFREMRNTESDAAIM